MKKITTHQFSALLLITLLVFTSFSCYKEEFPGRPTVALVVKTLNNPFFNDMQTGAEEMARELEINLIVQAAEREVDVEQQVQIVENLIQRRVDAIMLTPSGSREVVPVIASANRNNIPIINLDTRVDADLLASDNAFVSTFIGSDNYEGGLIAGRYVGEQLNGVGKVAILEGIPGHETADSRQQGFLSGIGEYPGIEIVTSQTANWERNMGYTVFQNILQSFNDVQAVFAASDLMALGAVEAIASSGRGPDDIIVVGFDAHVEAVDAIRRGVMHATIAQNPYEIGRAGVEYAYKVLNGEEIPNNINVEIKLITRDNVDE
jgi:ribose transport system substrate-binding protein